MAHMLFNPNAFTAQKATGIHLLLEMMDASSILRSKTQNGTDETFPPP